MIVSENLNIRHFQPDDVEAIVSVYNAAYAAAGDERRSSPEELRMFIEAPDFDPAQDSFVVERDGRLIAYADFELNVAAGVGWSECAVHPNHGNKGIGAQLIRLTDARSLERAQTEMPPDRPLRMQRACLDSNQAAIRLFEAEGYRHVRTFYRMRIDLDEPVVVPPLPTGLELRPFDPAVHTYAFYQTHQEAFADHWGFTPNSFEEWSHYIVHNPNSDLSLWLVAYDGDDIAGICINRPYGDDDPQMGWVGTLAVRRPWRKRGLGLALLQQSFALFQQRGYQRVALGVDASSLTNAVALYERAGMRVTMRNLAYRKVLRGEDADD